MRKLKFLIIAMLLFGIAAKLEILGLKQLKNDHEEYLYMLRTEEIVLEVPIRGRSSWDYIVGGKGI